MGQVPDDMPTAVDAAASIRSGAYTSVELVERCLAEIDRRNGELNAFVHLDADGARAAAAAVDEAIAAGRDVGPFAGVPIGIKDLEDCAVLPMGMAPTARSRATWIESCSTGAPPL